MKLERSKYPIDILLLYVKIPILLEGWSWSVDSMTVTYKALYDEERMGKEQKWTSTIRRINQSVSNVIHTASTHGAFPGFPHLARVHEHLRVLLFWLVKAWKSRKKLTKSRKNRKSHKFKKPGSVPSKARIFECIKGRLGFSFERENSYFPAFWLVTAGKSR